MQRLSHVTLDADAWLSSETAGAMIDRLSILSLKIFHMRLQIERPDVDDAHRESCKQKLSRLTEQRNNLKKCLDTVLAAAEQGRAYFKNLPAIQNVRRSKLKFMLVSK